VTDANLLLGRLDAESFLGGGVHLDRERTERLMREQKGTLATVEEFAAGILRVIETQMEKAIRVISVERGHDPRDFTLVAFGGGGPLHACSLARALRIPRVLVPTLPGALSALGILLAETVRDSSRTVMLPGEAIHNLDEPFNELVREAAEEFIAKGVTAVAERTLDLRYRRQGFELNVAFDAENPARALDAFHRLHELRYGFADPARAVEIINVRVRMSSAGEAYRPQPRELKPGDCSAARYDERPVYFDNVQCGGGFRPTRFFKREKLAPGDAIRGPAMITEYTAATLVPPACTARVDGFGNLLIEIGEEENA
jgi:N-methylhydantoinase A